MIKVKFPKHRTIKFREKFLNQGGKLSSLRLFRVQKINRDNGLFFLNCYVVVGEGRNSPLLLTFSEKVASRLYDNLKEIFESQKSK